MLSLLLFLVYIIAICLVLVNSFFFKEYEAFYILTLMSILQGLAFLIGLFPKGKHQHHSRGVRCNRRRENVTNIERLISEIMIIKLTQISSI